MSHSFFRRTVKSQMQMPMNRVSAEIRKTIIASREQEKLLARMEARKRRRIHKQEGKTDEQGEAGGR
jgi:hypothetical protein